MEATNEQVAVTREVVAWYLRHHHDSRLNPGFPGMYSDPAQVGHLAVSLDALRAGDARTLYRALVATVMFQTMRDELVRRRLRTFSAADAAGLTDQPGLVTAARSLPCGAACSTDLLRERCDLHLAAAEATCATAPGFSCQLKAHTQLLRRYGHFGKVPTSLALMVEESGGGDLPGLYRSATAGGDPQAAAVALVAALSRAWRVNEKLAAMFLSLVANPDVLPGAPWQVGVAWTHFVVIDTNVDRYLRAVGYAGPWTYRARREFLWELSARINLVELDPRLRPYNPRVVQQAAYLFMSRSNRLASPVDCARSGVCGGCAVSLSARCAVADLAGPPKTAEAPPEGRL